MKQMKADQVLEVSIDYNRPEISEIARIFHPLVYLEGDGFCCVLGPDFQIGITGCGDTADAAIEDWVGAVRKEIDTPKADPDTIAFVKETLKKNNIVL